MDDSEKLEATIAALNSELQQADATVAQTQAYTSVPPPNHEPLWWSNKNAMTMSSLILTFGLIICAIGGYFLKKGADPDSLLKFFGTIVIIMGALFLVVAGYDDKQIGPVMGLLGTMVGYLLGKGASPEKPRD